MGLLPTAESKGRMTAPGPMAGAHFHEVLAT